MQFREEQVDEIRIVEGCSKVSIINKLDKLAKDYIFIDIQYALHAEPFYSALVLLRKKS